MTTTRHISNLRHIAKKSDEGFLQACRRIGTVRGAGNGETIEFDREHFQTLLSKYNSTYRPKPSPPRAPHPHKFRLGDMVHPVALWIAKFLRLSCIDKLTGKLKPDSPCARRRRGLNTWSDRLTFKIRKFLNL